jgi:VWFA-related protein
MTMRSTSLFFAAILFALTSYSQDTPNPPNAPTVLKSNTRLVMVDVVATDKNGAPVTDLKDQDFVVYEDGRPQRVGSFNFQSPGVASAGGDEQLPKNVVTNLPRNTTTSLNVILLDRLNGESRSQVYAQDRLVKFLETGAAIQPTAIYVLDKKLTVAHDFTTDTTVLKDALNKLRPGGAARIAAVDVSASPFATTGDFHTNENSVSITLQALLAIAKNLAGYPGRKNLIWVSEAFPVSLLIEGVPNSPSPNAMISNNRGGLPMVTDSRDGLTARSEVPSDLQERVQSGQQDSSPASVSPNAAKSFAAELARIVDALMDAHVSLYPIDAAGMGQANRLAAHTNMQDMADRTGGRAFYNRNDIEVGIRASVNDGSTYYALSYYPENRTWDGRFRKIEIKTARPGINLRYRMGYYAVDPVATAKIETSELSQEFSRALAFDSPPFASLRFKATINPPAEKAQKWTVTFAVDPRSILFEHAQDGLEHAAISCAVSVYSDKGVPAKILNNDISTMNAALNPEQYQKMMAKEFPCKRSLDLKPGKYTLRLAAMDKNSRMIGATTTSITVE